MQGPLSETGRSAFSNKRGLDRNPKVFLACIQVFRPDFLATASFGGGNDHSVVKMDSVLRLDPHGSENDIPVDWDELDRPERI